MPFHQVCDNREADVALQPGQQALHLQQFYKNDVFYAFQMFFDLNQLEQNRFLHKRNHSFNPIMSPFIYKTVKVVNKQISSFKAVTSEWECI